VFVITNIALVVVIPKIKAWGSRNTPPYFSCDIRCDIYVIIRYGTFLFPYFLSILS